MWCGYCFHRFSARNITTQHLLLLSVYYFGIRCLPSTCHKCEWLSVLVLMHYRSVSLCGCFGWHFRSVAEYRPPTQEPEEDMLCRMQRPCKLLQLTFIITLLMYKHVRAMISCMYSMWQYVMLTVILFRSIPFITPFSIPLCSVPFHFLLEKKTVLTYAKWTHASEQFWNKIIWGHTEQFIGAVEIV